MKHAVKIILISCAFCLGALTPVCAKPMAAGAVIHVILFSATDDARVGNSCKETNIFFEKTFVPLLNDFSGASVRAHVYSGDNFTLDNLNRAISGLNTSPDDVIFFFFAGHGYNRGNNPYPTLTLGKDYEDLEGRERDLFDVYNTLRRKPRRLLVALAEACNKPFEEQEDIRGGNVGSNFNADPANRNNIIKLFRETSGDYLMSSSAKNEYSYLASGKPGFFTCAFMNAFREVSGKSYTGKVAWETVFESTAVQTYDYARENGRRQSPQWQKGDSPPVVRPAPPSAPTAKTTPKPLTKTTGAGSFTDLRDGKAYRTIEIAGQTWMAQNLNYGTGASWCYDNENSNCNRHGRLYDWASARTACPNGWSLPNRADWNDLAKAAGSGGMEWQTTLGGFRSGDNRNFKGMGTQGYWWSASEKPGDNFAYIRIARTNGSALNETTHPKSNGASVRCVRND